MLYHRQRNYNGFNGQIIIFSNFSE